MLECRYRDTATSKFRRIGGQESTVVFPGSLQTWKVDRCLGFCMPLGCCNVKLQLEKSSQQNPLKPSFNLRSPDLKYRSREFLETSRSFCDAHRTWCSPYMAWAKILTKWSKLYAEISDNHQGGGGDGKGSSRAHETRHNMELSQLKLYRILSMYSRNPFVIPTNPHKAPRPPLS